MSRRFVMRRGSLVAACSGVILSIAMYGYAQVAVGVGLVTGVDVATGTLTLETQSGPQRVIVAPTAAIDDDNGRALALRDINAGDAIVYQRGSGSATSVHVARQFWAIPSKS